MLTPEELDRLRVVLVSSRNALNIGAAARAMSNFGFLRLRLVHPYEPAYRGARSAVGAAAVLATSEEYGTVAEAVADCTLVVGTTAVGDRALHHPLKRLETGGDTIREHLRSGNVAVLFGSEKIGLTNEDLSHCHWLMRIPSREEHISMNLGQAVGICLYEFIRDPEGPLPARPEIPSGGRRGKERERFLDDTPATASEVERMTMQLIEALHTSGYVNPAASTDEKVRRLVNRLKLPARDVETWLGILRQLMWKMKSPTS
ncbi:MAG TPA: TrmH family RNA methyltransferase [Terriglobales bacterium]|nr:TrmH family RNA methyltransferase [Terriglobales bacterium]